MNLVPTILQNCAKKVMYEIVIANQRLWTPPSDEPRNGPECGLEYLNQGRKILLWARAAELIHHH